jgi:DNA-binding response OmpR family regulator
MCRTKKEDTLSIGDIVIDFDKSFVSKNGHHIELTALEYRIFSMLAQNIGKTVTRDSILERIWDIAGNYVNDNTLTVYIKRIRAKLDTNIIKTVKGVGYRLEEK